MKQRAKCLFLSTITALTICGGISPALADVASDTEKLLNWAQNTYKDLFPSIQHTQTLEPWLYRYYPETGIYAGVNKNDNNAYVLGGSFGNTPRKVDSLSTLIAQVDSSGGNTGVPACDTAKVPTGITMNQSGNVVTLTTKDCLAVSSINQDPNICKFPPPDANSARISILETTQITGSDVKGASLDSFLDLIKAMASTALNNSKTCTMNVSVGAGNRIVYTEACLDITSTMQAFGVTTPSQLFIKTTTTGQIVDDCFKTDAKIIIDAATGQVTKR